MNTPFYTPPFNPQDIPMNVPFDIRQLIPPGSPLNLVPDPSQIPVPSPGGILGGIGLPAVDEKIRYYGVWFLLGLVVLIGLLGLVLTSERGKVIVETTKGKIKEVGEAAAVA